MAMMMTMMMLVRMSINGKEESKGEEKVSLKIEHFDALIQKIFFMCVGSKSSIDESATAAHFLDALASLRPMMEIN